MSSMTVHDLDDAVAKLIKARARADGTSVNRTIKRLLEEALGVKPAAGTHRKEFEKFLGVWSKAEVAEFEAALADTRAIDPDDWK